MQEVLVNRLGLSLPRKSVVRLTDCPDMTLAVYCGCKTTIQQQQYKRVIIWKQGLHQRTQKLSSVQVFFGVRQDSFPKLGLLCDPQIYSKLQNVINDSKGIEKKNRAGRYLTVTTQSQLPAVVKFNMLCKRVISLQLAKEGFRKALSWLN